MAILDILRPDESVPVVIIVSASELNARGGALLREAQMGAHIRVDDLRGKRTVAWISAEPPASVRPILGKMPEPGTVSDHLAANLEVPASE